MACGEMGLTVVVLYSLTPRQFYNIQTGYLKKQQALLENDWLQTKVISYFIYSSIPKKKANQKSFPDFTESFFNVKKDFKLPTNDLSKEEKKEEADAFFDNIDTRKNGKS
jgi:hypothetical protein